MSVETKTSTLNFQGELFNDYSKIPNFFKPKIKEIVTLTIRNLIDLTTCLIQTHHSFINPKFSSLKISKILDYEIEAWHNEILSSTIANRRNLARLMTDLKYMLSSVNGTESLFMEITKLTNSIREKWTPTAMNSTGAKFREVMLDMVLISDPSIKGFYTEDLYFKQDSETIQNRISEFSQQTRTFLEMRTHSGYQSTNYQMDDMTKKAESIELELIAQNLEENYVHLRDESILQKSVKDNYETRGKVNSSHMQKNKEISYGTGTVGKRGVNDEILITYSSNESTKKENNRTGTGVMGIKLHKQNPTISKKFGNTRSEPTFEKSKLSGNFNREEIKENIQNENEENNIDYQEVQALQVESIYNPIELESSSRDIHNIQKNLTPKKKTNHSVQKPDKIVVTPLKELKDTQNQIGIQEFGIENESLSVEKSPISPKLSLNKISERNSMKSERSKSKPKMKYKNSHVDNDLEYSHNSYEVGSNFPTFKPKDDTLKFSKLTDLDEIRNSTVSFNGVCVEEEFPKQKKSTKDDDYRIALKKIRKKKKSKFINEKSDKENIISKEIVEKEELLIVKKQSKVFKMKHIDESIQQDPGSLPTFSDKCLTENIFTHKRSNSSTFRADKTPRRAVSDNFYQNNTPRQVDKQCGEISTRTPLKYSNQDTSEKSVERIRKFVHDSNFNIREFLSNRDSEKIHLNAKGLQKIVLSNDGNYLIYGGEGLNVLDMTTDDFKIIRNDKKKKIVFNSIKVLHNDNILVTEPITNDLVVYNTVFQEVHRIKGIEGAGFDNEAIRNSCCSNEGQYFVWFKGNNKVSIVNTITLRFKDIPLLKSNSLPVATATNKKLTKLGVLSVTETSKIYLNFWQKGEKIRKKDITSICSKIKAAMTMEVSEDGEILYIGGCDRMNVEEGKPILAALRFDKSLEEIDTLRLHADSMRNIFRIRRIPETDALIVSGFEILSIVELRNRNKLVELKQLRGLHSGEIFDFVLRGREIFSVASNDGYIHKF